MYARTNTVQVKPGKIDELVYIFKEALTQAHDDSEARQGHKETYLMVDRENDKVVSIAFWETEVDMQNSVNSQWNKELVEKATPTMVEPPKREFFKVEAKG